jgi:DNA polymerase-3 subunit delta
MILNLNKWLNLGYLPQACLINSSEECYPLVTFAISQLQAKLAGHAKYKFTADRYFEYTEVEQIINSGSLFEDKNYIEINYKTKPTADQQQSLIDIISQLNDRSFLVITTDKLTKKELTLSWVEAINKSGVLLSLNEDEARTAVNYILQQHKLTLSPQALTLLLELNQANLAQLLQEVYKLTLIHPAGSNLEVTDIQTNNNSHYTIYQLSSAYLSANFPLALKILESLYTATEDAILILWVISEDIRKLIKLKAKLKQNNNIQQALQEIKAWGDNAHKLQLAEHRLSYRDLIQLFDQLTEIDLAIKGIANNNIKQQLIHIISKFCHKGS